MKLSLTHSLKVMIVLTAIAGIAFYGCGKDDDDSTPTPTPTPTDTCGTPLMSFLASGHIEKYNITYFGTTDTLTMTMSSYGSNDEFRTALKAPILGIVDTVYSKECGGWLYRSSNYPLISTYKYRKSSTAVNNTYTYSDATTTVNYKIVAKNVSVTVPAGTFVCDKITYQQVGTLNTDTIYFNNTVGDVKYVGSIIDYELKSKNF